MPGPRTRPLALVVLLAVSGCKSPVVVPNDGLDTFRTMSEGPVWGRRATDGTLVTLWWDVPADDTGSVSPERAVLRTLGLELGIFDVDGGTRLVGTFPIAPGGTVTIFQLVHAGVDVVGAEVRIVRVADRIRFVTARVPPNILLDVEPMVSAEDAASGLAAQLELAMTPPMSTPELVVWDSAMMLGRGGAPTLAWRIRVGFSPNGGTAFVSATTGNLLQVLPGRESSTQVYFVRQSADSFAFTAMGGTRELWFADPGGAMVTPPTAEPAATNFREAEAAYMDAPQIEAYFRDNFGWDGYDGMGADVDVFVGFSASCPFCPSAAWCGEEYTARVRGTDEFAEYFTFSTGYYSSDIFAHEFTHAVLDHVTQREPFNFGEPGATEESLADTFAAFFDAASPWLIGDGLDPTLQRDLRTPGDSNLGELCAQQPEEVAGQVALRTTGAACGLADVGGCTLANDRICLGNTCFERDADGFAHCNSSIPSLAAYRLTDGDPMLDIVGMGAAKAQAIYFSALSLVGRWETFPDLRDHLLASCFVWALSGEVPVGASGPITPADCGDLINAFHSVGIGQIADADRDGWDDGVDNCRGIPNFEQADEDLNRVGDVCERLGPGGRVMRYCWRRNDQECELDDDPSEPLRAGCMGDGAQYGDGFCPTGGSACVSADASGRSGTVFYDENATANADRRVSCEADASAWVSSWTPPPGG
ncbi:MAG: M4 family metallopeptidase [Sandaracinaceae bacterium]